MYQNVSSAPAYSAEVLGCLIFFSKPGGKRNQLQKRKTRTNRSKNKTKPIFAAFRNYTNGWKVASWTIFSSQICFETVHSPSSAPCSLFLFVLKRIRCIEVLPFVVCLSWAVNADLLGKKIRKTLSCCQIKKKVYRPCLFFLSFFLQPASEASHSSNLTSAHGLPPPPSARKPTRGRARENLTRTHIISYLPSLLLLEEQFRLFSSVCED